jgi:hypothetical protein
MSGKDGQPPPPKLYSIYHWGSRSVKLQIQYMAPHVQTFALLQEVGRTENFPKIRFTKLILLPIYEEYEQIDHQ